MIRSMTGFGGAFGERNGAHASVEIRSVNAKFFKAIVRLPEELQELEGVIEAAIARRLSRGSVTATIRWSDESEDAAARLNGLALRRYVDQLREVRREHPEESFTIDLGAMLALPGVVVNESNVERLEHAKTTLLPLVDDACEKVLGMRDREGEALHTDLHRHCARIRTHLEVIADRAPAVVEEYQDRLRQRMTVLLAEVGSVAKEEDLLREVAVFADRSDIAEEVTRLGGHLSQFEEIIDADDAEPAGRTLDFLSQEMLREANTIGSKCLDVEIARRIVEIKGAIDRIKEQAQNVE